MPTYPSHETVETMSTKTVSRESRDVRVLLSIYVGRDDSSISSEPLQEEKFSSVPMSDESPPGGTLYNGLYGDVLPERGNFLRLEVYKRVGILRVKV